MNYYSQYQKDPELIDCSSGDYISDNFKCSKKTDHILEMTGLGPLFYYRFINHVCEIRLQRRLTNFKLIPGVSDYFCLHIVNVRDICECRVA